MLPLPGPTFVPRVLLIAPDFHIKSEGWTTSVIVWVFLVIFLIIRPLEPNKAIDFFKNATTDAQTKPCAIRIMFFTGSYIAELRKQLFLVFFLNTYALIFHSEN